MSIKEREELLFQKLREKDPDIVADGVICEQEFLNARYKIVYILKEVNGGKSWDLRDFVYEGGRPQTFVINPMTYKEWIKLGVTEGYTEEDYQNFKRTALVATTSYATNAKEGCENEFAIFVETDPDLYLPNLSEYITFKKEEEINVIDISDCTEILSAMKNRIKNVEVYYNPYTTKLVSAIEEAKIYNIVTQKEV